MHLSRLIALAVFGACVGFLVYLHRDDLWPPPVEEASGNPAFEACKAQRFGEIENMRQQAVIDENQEQQFKARAEAFCWDQNKDAEGLPAAAQ